MPAPSLNSLSFAAVTSGLFERLGSRGAQLAQPLVERVGVLCAEAAEAEAERDEGEAAAPYESAAAAAMGAAIRHLGPQHVLSILPLNIAEVPPAQSRLTNDFVPALALSTQLAEGAHSWRIHWVGSQVQLAATPV